MANFATAQYSMLGLLWLAYASSYLLRRPLAIIKSDLINELGFTSSMLGWLDVALLLPYSLVSIFFGHLGEKFGARLILGLGLAFSGIMLTLLGFTQRFLDMVFLFVLIGASHSLAWPTCSAILSKWFKKQEHNYIFGILGASCFAGSVLSTYFIIFFHHVFRWKGVFLAAGCVPFVLALIILKFAKHPSAYGYYDCEQNALETSSETLLDGDVQSGSYSLSFVQVLQLPSMIAVCICIFCCKCLRYAFLLWLPLFLQQAFSYSTVLAGIGSSAFDVGGVLGSLLNGFIVKRFFRDKNYVATAGCSFLCAVSLLVLVSAQFFVNSFVLLIVLLLAGLFNACTDILLTGPIATSIGESCGSPVAVIGVVNGVGSLGAVVQGPLVALVSSTGGWHLVLVALVAFSVVATLAALSAHRSSKCELS